MATLTSQEILNATVSMGLSKANQCWIARAANTLLAGMYIAIGGFLAIRIGLALPWEQWGGMSKLIFGAVFPLGLMLVVLCGAVGCAVFGGCVVGGGLGSCGGFCGCCAGLVGVRCSCVCGCCGLCCCVCWCWFWVLVVWVVDLFCVVVDFIKFLIFFNVYII